MAFIYPPAFELRSIQQDFMNETLAERLGPKIIPIQNSNAPKVRWTQQDNYHGLAQLRGMDGAPTRVNRVGWKTYEYEPGVFGEFVDITEQELTTRAASLDVAAVPIDIGDLVNEADRYLIVREVDRIESSIWTLLGSGVLQILLDGPDGTQIGYNDSYTVQTFTSSPLWSSTSTATPIKDFQTTQQLGYAAGRSVDFGAGAVAYMNQYTANLLLNNSNANDFGGRRTQFGATLNNLTNVASYWQAQNLPSIVSYDNGYWTKPASGTSYFTKFIANGKVIIVGKRPNGVAIGNYLMTRNASNGFKPGTYRYVLDRANGSFGVGAVAEKRTPANIEIHRGHNGGPTLYYPSAVIVMTVA
jgi:hypothetical protein